MRWTMMKAEAHLMLMKNNEGEDYDYIDLKGINDVLNPLRLKYLISDKFTIVHQENKNGPDVDKPAIKMIDLMTGEEKDCISLPWPGFDQSYRNMSKAQMIGANLTYIRRYLLMCAYDISVGKDAFDSEQNIPSVGMKNNQNPTTEHNLPLHPNIPQNFTPPQNFKQPQIDNDGFTIMEEESQDDDEAWNGNALEDARDTILVAGPYAGMKLGDVEKLDPGFVVNAASDTRTDIGAKCRLILEMTK